MTFRGAIVSLLDGIDDDEELASARAVSDDGRSFVGGSCVTCQTPILPYCPWGPSDPVKPAQTAHFVTRQIAHPGGGKAHICSRAHVDGTGRRVETGIAYACGDCGFPLTKPAPGTLEKCPRCGRLNWACSFHNSPWYAEKKSGADAYRLVVLEKAPEETQVCGLCKAGILSAAPELKPAPKPQAPRQEPPPSPPPVAVGKKWRCLDSECSWEGVLVNPPCPVCGSENMQELGPAVPTSS